MADEISFQLAPLIEIVAELRWLPKGLTPKAGEPIALADTDGFTMAFGRRPEIAEFTNAEKLIPAGFPTPWHNIAWRFRNPKNEAVLLQVGAGIFSANALQPYKHWKDFRPTVVAGVTALLASRSESERDLPFSGVMLRYIDAFTDDLLDGRTPAELMKDVLGFNVETPKALSALYGDDRTGAATSLKLLIPVANTSKKLSVSVGEGTASGNPALMLDMTVSESSPVAPDLDSIMKALDESRDIIHQTFVDMTGAIHETMKPVKA